MPTYFQAEPHWTLSFAAKRFFDEANVRPVPLNELISLDAVIYDLNIPVRTALNSLDCLIPPYGAALFHPDSVLRHVKRKMRKTLKLTKEDLCNRLEELRRARENLPPS